MMSDTSGQEATSLFDIHQAMSPAPATYLSESSELPNLLCDSILLKTSMGTSLSTSVTGDSSLGAAVPGILYVTSYKELIRAGPALAEMVNGFLTVAQELSEVDLPFAEGKALHRILLEDNENTQLKDWIPDVFSFIDRHARDGKAVVIFCQAGKSRSVSLALAYMMREYKISTEQALDTLRRGYNRADPNINFLMQLRSLEGYLHSLVTPS